MVKQRSNKPTPKSQREISNSFIEPYDTSRGNPNNADPKINQPDFNRGNKISWKGDTTKPFTIGLQDIDESIMYYFNEVIKPTVEQNGKNIKVPIIYGSPEKWKLFQKDGYYRDKKGKVMQPLIMFKRDGMIKTPGVSNKLDANNPNNYGVFQKKYTNRNSYDQFSVLNNRIPDKEYIAVVYPDYVTITYSCSVSTYYVSQMNKIIEAINYAADSYWGDPKRFKFMATIEDFQDEIVEGEGQDRKAKTNFTLVIKGYIIPDIVQKSLNDINKFNKKTTLSFSMEIIEDSEFFKADAKIEPSSSPRFRTSNSPSSSPPVPIIPYNDISFAISDETTDLTDNGGLPVYTGIITRDITFTEIIASQTTPSDIGDYTFYDIHINGNSIFSGGTYLVMDGGQYSSIGSSLPYTLGQTSASKGDLIEIYILYVAATTPGTGAKIYILGT